LTRQRSASFVRPEKKKKRLRAFPRTKREKREENEPYVAIETIFLALSHVRQDYRLGCVTVLSPRGGKSEVFFGGMG
jgi:hypothetical protein